MMLKKIGVWIYKLWTPSTPSKFSFFIKNTPIITLRPKTPTNGARVLRGLIEGVEVDGKKGLKEIKVLK